MSKKYRVFLNGKKRSDLKRMVNTGTDKARKLTRARILLLVDESPRGPSKKDKEIMEALGVCARTAALTRQQFTEGDIQGALNEKPRLQTGFGRAVVLVFSLIDDSRDLPAGKVAIEYKFQFQFYETFFQVEFQFVHIV